MLLKHIRSRGILNNAYDAEVRGRFARPFETVETHLSKHTFLVGERLSLADISAATVLRTAYSFLLGNAERAKYPHTFRFYETVISQPSIKDILSGGQLAEMAQEYVPPIKAPSEEKPKAETPKAETARRAEYEEEEPQRKIPLDDLPKSSFNLEEWKRVYSNLKTRGVGGSLEWFSEKQVILQHSLIRSIDDHSTKVRQRGILYLACGLQVPRRPYAGIHELQPNRWFFQCAQILLLIIFCWLTHLNLNYIIMVDRLEGSRKYLFGSIGVLGTANNSLISGALVLRGQDYKPVVQIAPDWESYGYKELDINSSEEDKKFFEAALAWDLSIDGKAWADGKNVSHSTLAVNS